MFVDEVRQSPVNNGFFPFDFARDITDLLRKQWAGMFFEFLQERLARDHQLGTTNLLHSIAVAGEKVEELVKRLYRHIDSSGAEASIEDVEKRSIVRKFLEECLGLSLGLKKSMDMSVDLGKFKFWHEYFAEATGAEVLKLKKGEIFIAWNGSGPVIKDPKFNASVREYDDQQERFKIFKTVPLDIISLILSEIQGKIE